MGLGFISAMIFVGGEGGFGGFWGGMGGCDNVVKNFNQLDDILDATHNRLDVSYALQTSFFLEEVPDATRLRLHFSWKTFLMLGTCDFMYLGRNS